jgi:hypothetical protein
MWKTYLCGMETNEIISTIIVVTILAVGWIIVIKEIMEIKSDD